MPQNTNTINLIPYNEFIKKEKKKEILRMKGIYLLKYFRLCLVTFLITIFYFFIGKLHIRTYDILISWGKKMILHFK